MAQAVIPSEDKTITEAQVGKILQDLGAALRKSGLSSTAVQQIIETQSLVLTGEIVGAIRKRVEAVSNLITRHVTVTERAPKAALEATGRTLYVDNDVVKAMPFGQSGEADVIFFKLDLKGGIISDADLDQEYELRGLKPADPYSLAAVNEADPAFADDHPNGTHWKDGKGKWCFATFSRWGGERIVYVSRSVNDWVVGWWFAGLRK